MRIRTKTWVEVQHTLLANVPFKSNTSHMQLGSAAAGIGVVSMFTVGVTGTVREAPDVIPTSADVPIFCNSRGRSSAIVLLKLSAPLSAELLDHGSGCWRWCGCHCSLPSRE